MAYDRYDTRGGPRDEGSRWSSEPSSQRDRGDWRGERSGGNRADRGSREERGFFERAGDEIASWFGDDDSSHRRHPEDRHGEQRGWGGDRSGSQRSGWGGGQAWGGDRGREMSRDRHQDRGRNWNDNRGTFASGGSSESDYNSGWQRELGGGGSGENWGRQSDRFRDRHREYRPLTGDYGRAERARDDEWNRDPYRSSSRAGSSDWSDRSRHEDAHYSGWRDRHMGELDRDYDDYRREHQSKFESDFGSWRERRQQKRGMMGQIHEHMEVFGNDDQHVGTVDRVAGDRLILTKSDDASGGSHHSISCSDIDRVEGDRVILDCSADQARNRWRDDGRGRALFEREDQGEMGPRMLDRSFEGTYR